MSSAYDKLVGNHKPGSITYIQLKNFLTYNNVEINPGPRLNMVIGANGTGKSSILCALCLGLGGEPKLLGRADDARQFIMHEKEKALVEIHLAPFPGEEEHHLRRVIDRNKGSERGNGRGASTFYINNQKCTIKDIQQLVKETYHISVDNLCTFLPQDKVGSFSGFDQQALLIETEKSLSGSQHLYNKHLQLIEYEIRLNSGDHNVDSIRAKLEKLLSEKQRFEREKARMEERNLALKQVELYKKAIGWKDYNNKAAEFNELKQETRRLKQEFEAAVKECEPLEARENELAERKDAMEAKFKQLDAQCQKHKAEMAKQQKKQENHEDSMESELIDIKQVESDRAKKIAVLNNAKTKVETLKQSLEGLPPEEDIDAEFSEASKRKKAAHRAWTQAKQDALHLQQEFRDHESKAERVSTRLAKLQDEKTQRMQALINHSPHLGTITKWLEANRKEFRRPVWGPVGVEVSMKTANAAAYLEQHVSNSILTSFIVEDKADYDKMYKEVRNNLKVPVNIILVRNGQLQELKRPMGDEKMEMLKREHGVIGYLDEAFTAPDAVLQGLRSMAAVHRVLVGGDETTKSLDDRGLLEILAAPDQSVGQKGKQSSCIFASKGPSSKKYTQQVSRYSGEISSRIDDISTARLLARGGDPGAKTNLEKELNKIHEAMNELRPKIEDAEKKKAELEKVGQEASELVLRAKSKKELHNKIKQKLANANSKLLDAEQDMATDDRSKKLELLKKIMSRISSTITALECHATSHDKLLETTFSSAGVRIDKDSAYFLWKKATEEHMAKRRSLQTIEQKALAAKAKERAKKEEAKAAMAKVIERDENGEMIPCDEETGALLEQELEDLQAALEEAEQKVHSIHNDPNAIRQYEANLAEIEQVEAQLAKVEGDKDSLGRKIQQELNSWKEALENSIEEINSRFVGYMAELGVTGEVRLKKGGQGGKDDCDFKNWGIEIKVSFREGVKAQVLSAQVQSGGERSVSTILFLMAMQSLMVSPFRCVDEINQGMDELNERAIFRRIVQNSTAPPQKDATDHCGQYFLITPKLLPSLLDMEQEAVTVLVVMNGPFNFDKPTDFNVGKIIAAARKKRSSIEPGEDEENQENVLPAASRRVSKKKRRSS